MAIGSARPLEDAARIAYRELILWLEQDYGYDRWDAYMMLSQCGRVRLGNFVDPKYTVGAAISKQYLTAANGSLGAMIAAPFAGLQFLLPQASLGK